jgi:hypothetical protein
MALIVLVRSGNDASPQHCTTLECFEGHRQQDPPKLYLLAQVVVAHPFEPTEQSARPHVGH